MTHRSAPHRATGTDATDATDAATGLDLLLAADGPLRPLLPVGPGLRMAAALAARPLAVARRGTGLAVELVRIGAGRSGVTPDPRDRRWSDPAWSRNPLLRRLVQAHLAASAAAADVVSDAELARADHERLRAAVTAVAQALAPSNGPLHPAAVRAARDSRGASLVRGARRLLTDQATPPRVPSFAEPDALAAIVVDNALVRPGAAALLGTPVDLSKIDQDAYVVAGADDRLVPWRACYGTTGMLGGRSRFVLAPGGHVRALVPPGHDRAFRGGEPAPEDPARRLATAGPGEGCWWSDHLTRLGARSGPLVDAPPELGGRGLHAVALAPGDHVLAR